MQQPHRSVILVLAGLLVAALTVSARAQETETVRVVVTSVSTESVFIDKGRTDGVIVGAEVRLFPPAGAPITAVVRAVSASSARADLPIGLEVPPVGTQGEIDVEAAPADAPDPEEPDTEPGRETPDHPPWEQDLADFDPSGPLLAPVSRQRAGERPRLITGRVYFNSLYSNDQGEGRSNDSLSARLGTSLRIANPFGRGGRVRFNADLDGHNSSFSRGGSSTDTELRIERLSYAIGGQDYSPYRLELGRYYSRYLPELGLIDGVEGALRLQNGLTIGAGAGALPLNNRARDWDGDFGVHVFVDYESEDPGRLLAVLGYQKTWHHGAEDRDQLAGRINWRISDTVRAFGSFRSDIYTGSDTLKSSGVELTEFWSQLRYTPSDKIGSSVSYSRFRWPELLRSDYRFIPVEVIEDGQVDRVSVSGWGRVTDTLRVSGNAGFWSDSDSDGTNGDLRFDWMSRDQDWPSLHASVFFTDGSFNSGRGFRLKARKRVGELDVYAGYELFDYDVSSGFSGSGSIIRHLLRAGASWNAGKWYYSVTGDYYFGDSDNEYTVGVYASYRF